MPQSSSACLRKVFKRPMFTGIVAGICPVVSVEKLNVFSYQIDLGNFSQKLEIGASVAIDGVCQTVVSIEGTVVKFEAIEETLHCTTLGSLKVGSQVNVERSLTMGAEIGGHFLAGHIIGTAEVLGVAQENQGEMLIKCSAKYLERIFPKGFIAVNGVSLTVGSVSKNSFSVHLIPETLRTTNLGLLTVGAFVNLELDHLTSVVVDTVVRLFDQKMAREKL